MKLKDEDTILIEVLVEIEPTIAKGDTKYLNMLIDGKVERSYSLPEMKKAIKLAITKTKEGRI
jgi:hypothetical protein